MTVIRGSCGSPFSNSFTCIPQGKGKCSTVFSVNCDHLFAVSAPNRDLPLSCTDTDGGGGGWGLPRAFLGLDAKRLCEPFISVKQRMETVEIVYPPLQEYYSVLLNLNEWPGNTSK